MTIFPRKNRKLPRSKIYTTKIALKKIAPKKKQETMSNTSKNTPKVGIDRITFATPNCYLSMKDLAIARGIDPNKFTIGIGQSQQAVPPNHQDIVTLGAQAALPLLPYIDLSLIHI